MEFTDGLHLEVLGNCSYPTNTSTSFFDSCLNSNLTHPMKSSINILYCNARSLLPKMDELAVIVDVRISPDLSYVVETRYL